MNPPRLHWCEEKGWLLDVPVVLSREQMRRIIDWAVPRQIDRWRSLPCGERRDSLEKAIKLLKQGKVQQVLVNETGEGVAFQATKSPSTKRFFA